MPSIDDFSNSQYLKKTDCEPPIVATIASVEVRDFDDGRKPVVLFRGDTKPLVAGAKTNRESIADIANQRDYTKWAGARIELYHDANVYTPSGQRVGGIRIRPPAQAKPGTGGDADLDDSWEDSL